MTSFDRVIIADWSAASSASPARPSENAIWLGSTDAAGTETRYFRTRATAEAALSDAIRFARGQGQRLLIGFDFPMGYPTGFAERLTGTASAASVWAWLARQISDDALNHNNRFAVAAAMNQRFGGTGPFWGRPASLPIAGLSETKPADYAALGLTERRHVETVVRRAQTVWKLYTTGAAGAQGLIGQPMIDRFSRMDGVAVWPFQAGDAPVVLAEVYPSLIARNVARAAPRIKDEAQVRLLSRALFTLSGKGAIGPLLNAPTGHFLADEGWILGAGFQPLLAEAAG